jgi:hypothetical protein
MDQTGVRLVFLLLAVATTWGILAPGNEPRRCLCLTQKDALVSQCRLLNNAVSNDIRDCIMEIY